MLCDAMKLRDENPEKPVVFVMVDRDFMLQGC